MIPSTVSWKYYRTDIYNAQVHGIACRIDIAVEDIYLKKVLPEDIDDYVMFVFMISKHNDKNYIITALKTAQNTGEEEKIDKGSYFACYLIPCYLEIMSSNLIITDLFKNDLEYTFDIENVFNKNHLNTFILPGNSITFN